MWGFGLAWRAEPPSSASKRWFGRGGRRLPSRSGPGRRGGGHEGCVREERGRGFGPSW